MISGILASPGIAFGQALLLKEEPIIISQRKIQSDEVDTQIERFKDGRNKSAQQLEIIKARAEKNLGADKAEILKLQQACHERKVAWSRHKSKLIKRFLPAHNQQIRITVLGEKIGLGVLRQIKDDGEVVMYCYLKFNEPVRYSLYESIGQESHFQFEEMNSPERKTFAEELHAACKFWNGRLRRIEPINYRGEKGEPFSFINNFWEIEVSVEEKRQKNLFLFKSSNYFRSKENCAEILEMIKKERKRYPVQNRATQGAIYYMINENWEIQEHVENNKPKDTKLHAIGNYFRIADIPKYILDVIIEERKKQLVNSFIEIQKNKRGIKPKTFKYSLP